MADHPSITGLILAGGQSRRMGTNKALLDLNGQTLIEHALTRLQPQVSQLLISTNITLPVSADVPQLADKLDNTGPLGGILTGLLFLEGNQENQWLLSVAVDTPLFPEDLAAQLWHAKQSGSLIVAARTAHREHPTFALWHTDLIPALSNYLIEENQRRLMNFIQHQTHQYVTFEQGKNDPFQNINRPEELADFIRQRKLASSGPSTASSEPSTVSSEKRTAASEKKN